MQTVNYLMKQLLIIILVLINKTVYLSTSRCNRLNPNLVHLCNGGKPPHFRLQFKCQLARTKAHTKLIETSVLCHTLHVTPSPLLTFNYSSQPASSHPATYTVVPLCHFHSLFLRRFARLLKSNIVTAHLLKASTGNESTRHISQFNNNGSVRAYKTEETREEVGERRRRERGES